MRNRGRKEEASSNAASAAPTVAVRYQANFTVPFHPLAPPAPLFFCAPYTRPRESFVFAAQRGPRTKTRASIYQRVKETERG